MLGLLASLSLWVQAADFKVIREYVPARDGVKIATTLLRPKTTERLPVLIEMQPYRKDDLFRARDYALHSFFARQGYVVIKADVRGTGSSFGAIPEREYSEVEIEDLYELIRHYAHQPWSNGRVGVFGISWSGFNALQVALRQPPELKAILAAHASDDLFHDDVHFVDGAFHVDEYELSIENDLSLPRSPEYKLDGDYFRDRFNQKPWFLKYKAQGRDSRFWQKESVRGQYDKLKTPALLIGGLLDGYRDAAIRLLESSAGPVQVIMGPWSHAWPHTGEPCPCFEWRDLALKWWDFYLKDKGAPPEDRRLDVFQRAGDPPSKSLQTVNGKWVRFNWRTRSERELVMNYDKAGWLTARAGAGLKSGFWWGDRTENMATEEGLVFDSLPVNVPVEVAGFAKIQWKARMNAPWSVWSVQLEDVFPDGQVALVTGATLNSSQRQSAEHPKADPPGQELSLALDLHYSTWTFQKGHKIRLRFMHGPFPMIWPSPFHTRSQVSQVNLRLPLLPIEAVEHHEFEIPVGLVESDPEVRSGPSHWPAQDLRFRKGGSSKVDWSADNEFSIGDQVHRSFEKVRYSVHDSIPWSAEFRGQAWHSVRWPSREVSVRTKIRVQSDRRLFHIRFTREAVENGKLLRRRTWHEKIPRDFH
ncbi:MAG: CocE/NonD family hydrolase [Bdellovibrionales bacterium]